MSKANRKPDPSTAMSVREIVATASVLFALTFIAFLVWSGFYTVREFEKAVVLRWGKFSDTVEPGLHFKIPWVEERILVDCSEHNLRLPWGIEEQAPRGSSATIDREEHENKLILTGDLYAAIVEWNVYWRVNDPKAFILKLNPDEVEETINAVSRSTMHRVVGDYSADEILTSKREEIALAALREL